MRRAAIAIVVWCSVGCGGSPAAPDRIQMATGDYYLNLQTSIPEGCPFGFSGTHAIVIARATLSHEGSVWVARPKTSMDGDFELRFQDDGQALLPLGVRVSGTIRGLASNAGYQTKYLNPDFTGTMLLSPSTGISLTGYAAPSGLVVTTSLSAIYSRSTFSVTCNITTGFWDLSTEPGPQ